MTNCGAALVADDVFALVVQPEQSPATLVATGEQGPAGASGASYTHSQPSGAAEWIVNHNLGYRPSVSAYSVGGQWMLANVIHMSLEQARIYFDGPVAGFAVCS